jgi:hypothetical protein
MIKQIFILIMLAFPITKVYSQQNVNTPKNYPGIYTALVFDQISTAIGVEFERYLLIRQKFILGARIGHLFKYKWGNANIISGSDDNITNSNWQLWTGGYWFTSGERQAEGFFINSGIGLNYTQSEEKYWVSPGVSNVIKGNGISPAIEAGVGFQFKINPTLAIRLGGCGAIFFPAAEDKSFSPKNTLSFRASIGF